METRSSTVGSIPLNQLVERDLSAKSELGKRTDQYELTDEDYDFLLSVD